MFVARGADAGVYIKGRGGVRVQGIVAMALPLVAGCHQNANSPQVQVTETAEAAVATSDPCSVRSSNLEYTSCWQELAKAARFQADETYARARQLAEQSDLQESYGGAERHWLGTPLEDTETTWADNLDQQCLFEGRIARGGTGTSALMAKCQFRRSQQRTLELERAIKLIESNS